jgi:hypothetical protein
MSTSNNTTHAEQQVDARLSPFEEPAEEPVQNELQKTPKREREDDAEDTGPADQVPASPSKKSSKKCASKSLSAKAAHQRIERLEKKLADMQAERAFASTMMEELAFLLPILKKGVQCSALRDNRSQRWENCTIIKVHECSDKYKTEYTILFYDCTQPVKFPLKRMSLHRKLLRQEEQTAYYYASKKACKALLAQIDDAAEDNAEVTEEA